MTPAIGTPVPEIEDTDVIALVVWEFGAARHGWITLTVHAGSQSDRISCSDVFDPFADLVSWLETAAEGRHSSFDINEEGLSTMLWLDREPGSHIGRLRVFEPDAFGGIETAHVDATIDVVQMIAAFVEAFTNFVETYDAAHWDQDHTIGFDDNGNMVELATTPVRTLSKIPLGSLTYFLNEILAAGGEDADPHMVQYRADARAEYERQLGVKALPETRRFRASDVSGPGAAGGNAGDNQDPAR